MESVHFRPIKWSPMSWAIVLGLKMVLSAGFMHGASPLGLWGSLGPVGPPRRGQMWLNQTKPKCWFGHTPRGPVPRPWRYRPVFDKDPGRPCPSSSMRLQSRKLENILRFTRNMDTALMGSETMWGVILCGDDYRYLSMKDRGR